jgi:hypothetical protein
MMMSTDASRQLFRIKLVHTIVWAIFAGSIVAIPLATVAGRFNLSAWLSVLVWVEVGILAFNGLHCPLTAIAARHTENRAPNFDIFLPEWLARWNKQIFGTLFAVAELYLGWRGPGGG